MKIFIPIFLSAAAVATASYWIQPNYKSPSVTSSITYPVSSILQRKIYPYSIVPGGVLNADELIASAKQDYYTAQHYKDIDVPKLKTVTYGSDTYRYSSYRKDGEIYWTRYAILVKAGEVLLSDGENFVRGRCGNLLSEKPQTPTLDHEPPGLYETPTEPMRFAWSLPGLARSDEPTTVPNPTATAKTMPTTTGDTRTTPTVPNSGGSLGGFSGPSGSSPLVQVVYLTNTTNNPPLTIFQNNPEPPSFPTECLIHCDEPPTTFNSPPTLTLPPTFPNVPTP